jgi:DNA (cytosine-5)-methyltransferase 1
LETEGYEVQPFIIPAAAKNAPHRRDRVWFIAYSKSGRTRKDIGGIWSEFNGCSEGIQKSGNAADTQSKERRKQPQENRTGKNRLLINYDEIGNVANTNGTNNKARSHKKILGQSDRQKADGHSNVERSNQWQNFPTQPPICSGDDGLPTELYGITFSKWRNESIKAYGNAIVPQIAYQLFQIINEL